MHDVNGHQLKAGDKVLVPAVVVDVYPGPDYCNVVIETTLGRKPDGHKNRYSDVNTAQLVKIAGDDVTLGL